MFLKTIFFLSNKKTCLRAFSWIFEEKFWKGRWAQNLNSIVFVWMVYTLLPTVILYSMDAKKIHLGKRAYCTCVKRSLTSKGLVFLNLFLFMVLCLLPLIVQKFGGFSALVEKSVARARLSLKLFWIKF